MTDISDLEDKYSGERVFLIGNGPSLSEIPLEELTNEYTFAMNKINYIYKSTDWRPTFYQFIQQNIDDEETNFVRENIEQGIRSFVTSDHKEIFEDVENLHFVNTIYTGFDPLRMATNATNPHTAYQSDVDENDLCEYWSENIAEKIYVYHSVLPAFQILFYLGFDEIYTVGMDLGFPCANEHMAFGDALQPADYGNVFRLVLDGIKKRVLLKSLSNLFLMNIYKIKYEILSKLNGGLSGEDHFVSDYEENFTFHDRNRELKNEHVTAERLSHTYNVTIQNATIGGELDVYSRVDIDTLLE